MSRLIDADLLIEWIDAGHLRNPNELCFSEADVVEMIDHMPTIEERKTGKWEERKVSSEKVIDEWQSERCSECGRYHTTPYMYFFDDYSFCPNCGADMRGVGHERSNK